MKMTRLYEVYEDLETDGIFSDLANLPDVSMPWEEYADALTLDFAYYARSADKIVSPIVNRKANDSYLDSNSRLSIALAIYTMNKTNWEKLYNTLSAEYSPLSNYDMIESETIETSENSTVLDTGSIETSKDGNDTETGTINDSGASSGQNGIYGFNSSQSVGSDDTEQTSSNTETHNLTFGHDTTDTETRDLTHTNERENEVTRTMSRSGNIGVTTSQQMLNSEREVWQWIFFDKVFSDIDSFLTIPIY